MPKFIRKKAFKTKNEAVEFSKKLGAELGTTNIQFWPLKPTSKQGKDYTMYSFNNMDAKNHRGKSNPKPPPRMALLYPDGPRKTNKQSQKFDTFTQIKNAKSTTFVLPAGILTASNMLTRRA